MPAIPENGTSRSEALSLLVTEIDCGEEILSDQRVELFPYRQWFSRTAEILNYLIGRDSIAVRNFVNLDFSPPSALELASESYGMFSSALRQQLRILRAVVDQVQKEVSMTSPAFPSQSESGSSATSSPMSTIKIFVSHSAEDAAIAKAFRNLVEASLILPDKALRCTSVEGNRLSPGDPGVEKLRDEIVGCQVVIGLLTEKSLDSGFVIMELGAAWGHRRITCPVLAPWVDFKRIPGPLQHTHAIRWDNQSDLGELIDVIHRATGFEKRSMGKVVAALSEFVATASQVLPPNSAPVQSGAASPRPVTTANDARVRLKAWLSSDAKSGKAYSYSGLDDELAIPAGSAKQFLPSIVSSEEFWKMEGNGDDAFLLASQWPRIRTNRDGW